MLDADLPTSRGYLPAPETLTVREPHRTVSTATAEGAAFEPRSQRSPVTGWPPPPSAGPAIRAARRVGCPRTSRFVFHYRLNWLVRVDLAKAWRPGILQAEATLFRTRASDAEPPRDLDWLRYTPALVTEYVDGTHASMLTGADGEALAAALQGAIARAQEKEAIVH